ncbi:hypothetical protein [Bifidobacterium moukalabense]|uniref:hypothetical protein n=1 Tax=Bifidobacterium moukalabense TaxID=1333651 RepID=UPI001FCEFC58|nr:hypothetical protein [Bifidobacterium moukalabense]
MFDALWYPYIINPFKEDRVTPLSTDSRCTQGRPVRYSWAGESTVRSDAYTTDIVTAIAERFASETANQELMQGEIESKHFRKYKSKLKAFLENKLNRLQEGKLTPLAAKSYPSNEQDGTHAYSSYVGIMKQRSTDQQKPRYDIMWESHRK